MITILTRDKGVITAFVRGVKSIKSKRSSATSLLSYSSFSLESKADTYTITEASVNKVFFGAGSDIVTLTVAQYFCELCNVFHPEERESEEFLRLI